MGQGEVVKAYIKCVALELGHEAEYKQKNGGRHFKRVRWQEER